MNRIETQVSGGCQCGAVRYHVSAVLDTSHICHCRMCQKASANFFIALVGVPRDAFRWTRGAPGIFKSSDLVERGFCHKCGTPLTYDFLTSKHLNITTGSLDNPEQFPPRMQFGIEGQMPWIDTLPAVQREGTTEETMTGPAASIKASNHQHPDHDTARWPE